MSRPVVVPIWSPQDSIDTAQAFHLELHNAERGVSQSQSRTGFGNRLMFSRSRERKARRMDALAVALLMILMAAFGCVVVLLSAPQAKADATSFAYAAHNATAVCEVIAEFPSAAGVLGIMAAIREDGLTNDQAAAAVVMSVSEVCPRYMYVLEAFADRGVNA